MEIFQFGDAMEAVLKPEDVESACRQFICDCDREFKTDWILSTKYDLATVIFVGTKD